AAVKQRMSRIRWLFVGRDGLRHGWRFLLFAVAMVVVVRFFEQPAIRVLAATFHVKRNTLSAPSIIVSDGFDLIMILIVTCFLRCANVVASIVTACRLTRRLADSFGLA